MDNEKGNNRYPPGFEHIEVMIEQANEQIRQIDEQIKKLQENHRGPALRLDPPGASRSRQLDNRSQQLVAYENRKKEIKQETFDRIERDLKTMDPKMGSVVRDNALEDLYGNEFKTMDIAEKNAERGKHKDIEASQRFMKSMSYTRIADTDKAKDIDPNIDPRRG